jgi:dTDP-4-dehydrorhamnose 3,5-epimerase-like enzyme
MQTPLPDPLEVQLGSLKMFRDERGLLSVIDALEEDFFQVKRVFFLSHFQIGVIRGGHGHHSCEQIVICLQGSLKFSFTLNGKSDSLNLSEGEFIYLPKKTWSTLESLDVSTLLTVLCSENYNTEDYFYDREYYKQDWIENE